MSKNFELLQKLGKEQDLLNLPGSGNGQAAANVTGTAAAVSPQPVKPGLEEVSSFVQQVFLATGGSVPRTVVFTSTEPATGCSWVAAHTAEVLASRIAGSVCVVDANLRDPSLHQQFGLESRAGLAEALQQPDPIRGIVQASDLPNLFVLTAGLATADSQTLLASDRMRMRIHELRSEFDFVLIDVAAMNVGSDAISLGRLVDGVVLVLKANASRKQTARQAVQNLQEGKARVLGAVLNQRQFPIPESIYRRL
jgi:capsular exopolysaccharide synthesis family protein